MKEIAINRTIGDYVVAEMQPCTQTRGLNFAVRKRKRALTPHTYISHHADVTDAVNAIMRYQANDKRRS